MIAELEELCLRQKIVGHSMKPSRLEEQQVQKM
jgi:hypothetical protein